MSDDQLEMIAMLRDTFGRYISNSYPFTERHKFLLAPEGFSVKAWSDYAEAGWLALRMPEELGGIGADAHAIGAIMENVGAGLLLEPILASAILGAGLILKAADAKQQLELLPQIAEGSVTLAFAHENAPNSKTCLLNGEGLTGVKINVLHGDAASRVVVSCDTSSGGKVLCLVDPLAAGIDRISYRLVDGRGAAKFTFTNATAEPLTLSQAPGVAARIIAEVEDEACLALCGEATGIINSLLDKTIEYLKVRQQFGRPLSSNQALQHRMTELFLLREEAMALTQEARNALALPHDQRSRLIHGARAYIITAARHVGNEAIQMHGGVGVTEELSISHYFRRLMVNAALFGSRAANFEAFLTADTANGQPSA